MDIKKIIAGIFLIIAMALGIFIGFKTGPAQADTAYGTGVVVTQDVQQAHEVPQSALRLRGN